MLDYPVKFTADDNGTVMVTSPDFPELTTFGEDRQDAMLHAIDALEEAIAARIAAREEIPTPGRGRFRVTLPTQTVVKILLYGAMRDQGVRKAELARRLRWHGPQVDRLFDFRHASRLDQLEAAFSALGAKLNVEITMDRRGRGESRRGN